MLIRVPQHKIHHAHVMKQQQQQLQLPQLVQRQQPLSPAVPIANQDATIHPQTRTSQHATDGADTGCRHSNFPRVVIHRRCIPDVNGTRAFPAASIVAKRAAGSLSRQFQCGPPGADSAGETPSSISPWLADTAFNLAAAAAAAAAAGTQHSGMD
jgi:hypothetical protein